MRKDNVAENDKKHNMAEVAKLCFKSHSTFAFLLLY